MNAAGKPVTAFDIARRFEGLTESPGVASNPQILAMLKLDQRWPGGDEVPWCSAFVNYVAWLLNLPRSKSLAARSWLSVGTPVQWDEAKRGFDVVILQRGSGHQPGPEILQAPGHVGFFASVTSELVQILGGNQSDAVSIASFPLSRVLGFRRLYEAQ